MTAALPSERECREWLATSRARLLVGVFAERGNGRLSRQIARAALQLEEA